MSKIISSPVGSFKIYPRGFLGTMQSPTIEKTNTSINNQVVGRMHFDVSMFDATKSTRITANMTIDKLYRDFVRSGSAKFEYREQVLVAALRAFGTLRFYDWYRAQFESPVFGQTNRQFLDDTFKFLMTGRRDLPINNWIDLVKADESNTGVHSYSTYAAEFFRCSGPRETPGSQPQLTEVLQSWVSREGGFNDLIGTLFILFGVVD